MAAIILQNPRSPVQFQSDDYPQTAETIRRAWDESNAERRHISDLTGRPIPLHPEPECLQLEPKGDPRR